MTATLMDGKSTLRVIPDELAGRIEKLQAARVHPGLGTLLVGDDPGSRSYVRAEHRDCAKVGISSIQRAALLAPMPGGVGPMTRGMLLTNVVEAAERAAASA